MDVKENLEAIFSHLEKLFTTKTVIGEPFTVGNITMVPVVNVMFGLGTGGGEGKDLKNQGGGGIGAGTGARLTPVAIIVIKGDDVSLLPITGRSSISSIMDKVPEMVGKLKDLKTQDNEQEEND